MSFNHLHQNLAGRLLEGEGLASHAQRRAAFDNAGLADPRGALIEKVANSACKVRDEDMDNVTKKPLDQLLSCWHGDLITVHSGFGLDN